MTRQDQSPSQGPSGEAGPSPPAADAPTEAEHASPALLPGSCARHPVARARARAEGGLRAGGPAPAEQQSAGEQTPQEPAGKTGAAVAIAEKEKKADEAAEEDEYEDVDIYTAEMTCKCGKKIAANAWFCPQCGRPYLVNMLFALVVLATSFALLNQLVQWLLHLASRGTR